MFNFVQDIAAAAALELVECFGQYDPVISTQFLALYQSCCVSERLNDLLHRAQLDPIQSKLAALLRQRQNLLARDVAYNTGASAVMSAVQSTLENDWQVCFIKMHYFLTTIYLKYNVTKSLTVIISKFHHINV